MEKVIKQRIGIDCAQDELVSAFGIMGQDFEIQIVSNKVFSNNKAGFPNLLAWGKKLKHQGVELEFVIEATGVYHEQVALYLFEQGQKISVVLPNKIKNFAGTEKIKTVNDKVAAQTIARFGLEKKVDTWQPPNKIYNELKQLTRERDQLNSELTLVRNQLHAEEAGAWPNKASIKRMKGRMTLIEKQKTEIVKEINAIVKGNKALKEKVSIICSIKGVGVLTAVTVIAETNGFNLIRNKKQLVSYAGLDVQEKVSGTSVHGKPRISHKGNSYLRKAMYFPALTAIKHAPKMKNIFVRLVSKHGIKMKAAVAVQRKMLELIYTLWKKNEPFDPKFEERKKLEQPIEAALNEMA